MKTPLIVSLFLGLFAIANLFGTQPDLIAEQLAFSGVAIFAYIVCRKLGWRFFRANARIFYWLFVLVLLVTYIIGFEARGSKRWIDLYFFNFQPSEFFKIFFIIFMADYFAKARKKSDNIGVFLRSVLYLAIPALIIFKQPDLGTTLVYVCIYAIILFFSRVPKRTIIYTGIVAMCTLPLLWFTLQDYQKQRVLSFANPEYDTQGTSYNMIQAIITTGSGKFFGRGLGYGTQSNLSFLPENHTDFAYSALVEQLGFFGGLCVLILYFILALYLVKRMIRYYRETEEDGYYKFLFMLGFFAYFTFQVFINIGMNMGIAPVVGIALPIISYGGSALVAFLIGLALLP